MDDAAADDAGRMGKQGGLTRLPERSDGKASVTVKMLSDEVE